MSKRIEKHESFILKNMNDLSRAEEIQNFQKKAVKECDFWGYEKDGDMIFHRPSEEGPALIRYNFSRSEIEKRGSTKNFWSSASSRTELIEEKAYYKHGKTHRPSEEGPALVKKWKVEDRDLNRLYGSTKQTSKKWFKDGRIHRPSEEGPAIILKIGDFVTKKVWCEEGRKRRKGGKFNEVRREYQKKKEYTKEGGRGWDLDFDGDPPEWKYDLSKEIPDKYKDLIRTENGWLLPKL